jgi:hypothetical protein
LRAAAAVAAAAADDDDDADEDDVLGIAADGDEEFARIPVACLISAQQR